MKRGLHGSVATSELDAPRSTERSTSTTFERARDEAEIAMRALLVILAMSPSPSAEDFADATCRASGALSHLSTLASARASVARRGHRQPS